MEILDTLDVARILLPSAASHSLPLLATEMGFTQPRPHRALDDADATRQLLLRLREEAALLDETLKESMLALVAPYDWSIARFFAEALTAPSPDPDGASTKVVESVRGKSAEPPPDDPAPVAALLGPDGPLDGVLPGYGHRDRQEPCLPGAVDRTRGAAWRAGGRLDEHPHAAGAADGQRPARAARVAAVGLQGLPAQGQVQLRVPAEVAPAPGRALQGCR